jgi:hypothetical protein
MGDNFDYGENGEFLAISLFAQTSVFDLEIGKMNLICKNKPSGGKE